MPECYTHGYVAAQALVRSAQVVASHPAFLAGANGPDPLVFYKFWHAKPQPNLLALAEKMHHEKTGEFLNTLVKLSITPVQQSYALGFLTHYASDCVLHPYFAAMCQRDGPYQRPNGERWLASSFDSALYYKNFKTHTVSLHAGTPVLVGEDLAQVANLLHEVILLVYEKDVPVVVLSDTFHDNLAVRRQLISKRSGRKVMAGLAERLIFSKKGKDWIRSRIQPAPPLKPLPETWTNPYTGQTHNITAEEVLVEAENAGAMCVTAAMDYWLGNIDAPQLEQILGNNDYFTGLPADLPAENAGLPEEQISTV